MDWCIGWFGQYVAIKEIKKKTSLLFDSMSCIYIIIGYWLSSTDDDFDFD